MSSDKQYEANRNNAKLSTGPKTSEGKAKVRLNALTHGLRADFSSVLPGECHEEFGERLQTFLDEYSPTSATQLHLVRQLAINSWKSDRADRFEITILFDQVEEAIEPLVDGPCEDPRSFGKTFLEKAAKASFDPGADAEKLRRYQFSLQRAFVRNLDALRKVRADDAKAQGTAAKAGLEAVPQESQDVRQECRTHKQEEVRQESPSHKQEDVRQESRTHNEEKAGIMPSKANLTAPIKANSNAPIKAKSPIYLSEMPGKGTKRGVTPRVELPPIRDSSSGWLDISCLKS